MTGRQTYFTASARVTGIEFKIFTSGYSKQTASVWLAGNIQADSYSVMSSAPRSPVCVSSGSLRLLLQGCVKNSITAPGPQLGRVAVIKLHHSASREGCVSPLASYFSQLHFYLTLFFLFWLFSVTFFKGIVKYFRIRLGSLLSKSATVCWQIKQTRCK